jgi:hypothetical protein
VRLFELELGVTNARELVGQLIEFEAEVQEQEYEEGALKVKIGYRLKGIGLDV